MFVYFEIEIYLTW